MTHSAEIPAEQTTDPTNLEIAEALDELGDLYELDGAVIHRIVAYRNAAKAVREAPVSITALARQGRATELPGIGAIIQEKVISLAETGEIPALVKLRAKFPPGLVEMTRLPGLGPKRARRLFEELHVDSLDALRTAAQEQEIRKLKGFGPKAEESILAGLDAVGAGQPRTRFVLDRALAIAEPFVEALREHPASDQVQLAGSARRMTDSVKDLDVIATAHDPIALSRAAAALDLVERAGTAVESGVRLRTHTGIQIDLRIVAPDQFGNLLQHFTGSKEHNMALRDAAVRKGLHVSEYGVLDDNTGETHRCATETEVYSLLGLEYIEPELRENRGELEAAAAGTLPDLIELGDLRGDLHCHTTASDGTASIEEMAAAARDAGYEYLAITDHSASFGFGDDLSPARLAEHDRRDPIGVGGRDRAARRLGGQHPPRRLTRLRRRRAGRAGLGDRQRALVVPDGLRHDDQADHQRDREPAGRRHRPPLGTQDRAPPPVFVRRRARDRGRGSHRNDAGDQRKPRQARPGRAQRPRGHGGRHPDPDQRRRPSHRRLRGRPLRGRDGAPGVADRVRRGQHRAMVRHRGAATAQPIVELTRLATHARR